MVIMLPNQANLISDKIFKFCCSQSLTAMRKTETGRFQSLGQTWWSPDDLSQTKFQQKGIPKCSSKEQYNGSVPMVKLLLPLTL